MPSYDVWFVGAWPSEVTVIHRRPVLWVSGGMRSLVMLHLFRAWRHKFTVMHTVLDDQIPDVTENLERLLDEWGYLKTVFVEPFKTFHTYKAEFGWPVSVVPESHDGTQPRTAKLSWPLMAPKWHCERVRKFMPLEAATASIGGDAVLVAEEGFPYRLPEQSWLRYRPMGDWTQEACIEYAQRCKIPIHPPYMQDCLSCTGSLHHWRELRQLYPKEFRRRWEEVQPVFAALKTACTDVSQEMKDLPNG